MNHSKDKKIDDVQLSADDVAGNTRHIRIVGGKIDSDALFVGGREILISHGREIYHLRLTAQNKLILTK